MDENHPLAGIPQTYGEIYQLSNKNRTMKKKKQEGSILPNNNNNYNSNNNNNNNNSNSNNNNNSNSRNHLPVITISPSPLSRASNVNDGRTEDLSFLDNLKQDDGLDGM